MRRVIAATLACASLGTCCAQAAKSPHPNDGHETMDVFDQRRFNQCKSANHCLHKLTDGTEIEQWESPGESYLEVTRKGVTNYSTYRMFYHDNKRLMKKGEQFQNFPVGVWRGYSRTGEVTEEVDHDRGFKITIADLDRVIAKQFSRDITHRGTGVGVLRQAVPKPTYVVTFQDVAGNDAAIRFVEVDGATGQILTQMVKNRSKD
jgi:hypothetical protein